MILFILLESTQKKFINLQSDIKNNDSKNYIPQTEINKYLEESVIAIR